MILRAVSVGTGLGIELRPDALAQLPERVRTRIGSGLVTGGMMALVRNAVLPDQEPESV